MAKAELEIRIVDTGGGGGAPAPAPAPAGGGGSAGGPAPSGGGSRSGGGSARGKAAGGGASKSKSGAADAMFGRLASRSVAGVGGGAAASRVGGQAAAGLARAGMAMGATAGAAAGAILGVVLSPLIVAGVTKAIVGADVGMASSYNGQVAFAQAMSGVRQQMAEMRRANELGPQLAKYEQLRSEAATALYDIITQIKGALLDVLIPIIEWMREMIKWAAAKFGWKEDAVKPLVDTILLEFERAARGAAPKGGII